MCDACWNLTRINFLYKTSPEGVYIMKVVKKATHKEMLKNMKEEAKKKFDVCNPERCPRCRISDG